MFRTNFTATTTEFEGYISASQNGIVRLSKESPERIKGLATDGLQSCICCIFMNRTDGRLSLIHSDLGVMESEIIKESEWVGHPCEVIMIKGSDYQDARSNLQYIFSREFMPQIIALIEKSNNIVDFKYENIEVALRGAVAVTRDYEINILKNYSRNICIGEYPPEIKLRHSINILNHGLLINTYHSLDLQFDSEKWTRMPEYSSMASDLIFSNSSDDKLTQLGMNFHRKANLNQQISIILDYQKELKDRVRNFSKLGNQLFSKRDIGKAIEYYLDALNWSRFSYPPNSLYIAGLYLNLSRSYKQIGDHEKSSMYATLCIEICKFFPEKNQAVEYLNFAREILEKTVINEDSNDNNAFTQIESEKLVPLCPLSENKEPIAHNALVESLNNKSGISFFSVRDKNNNNVDAYADVTEQMDEATKLNEVLKGHGNFFNHKDKTIFVLEGIDSPKKSDVSGLIDSYLNSP